MEMVEDVAVVRWVTRVANLLRDHELITNICMNPSIMQS